MSPFFGADPPRHQTLSVSFREGGRLKARGTGERRLVQAPAVREPTRWGWGVALKAVIYFLRPEGFLPRGTWVLKKLTTGLRRSLHHTVRNRAGPPLTDNPLCDMFHSNSYWKPYPEWLRDRPFEATATGSITGWNAGANSRPLI